MTTNKKEELETKCAVQAQTILQLEAQQPQSSRQLELLQANHNTLSNELSIPATTESEAESLTSHLEVTMAELVKVNKTDANNSSLNEISTPLPLDAMCQGGAFDSNMDGVGIRINEPVEEERNATPEADQELNMESDTGVNSESTLINEEVEAESSTEASNRSSKLDNSSNHNHSSLLPPPQDV